MAVNSIVKRDGRTVEFDISKIAEAITKAFNATYRTGSDELSLKLAEEVMSILELEGIDSPEVEHIQDIVERVLMDNGYISTAKAFILYKIGRAHV